MGLSPSPGMVWGTPGPIVGKEPLNLDLDQGVSSPGTGATYERYASNVHAARFSRLEVFLNISVRIVHHPQGKLRVVTFELLSTVCLDNLTLVLNNSIQTIAKGTAPVVCVIELRNPWGNYPT